VVVYATNLKKTNPDHRFDQHKAGIKCHKYAMKYGIRLMSEIYEKLNPMPSGNAQYMEVDLAIRLQQLGYGVWQN
jgi:predicted transcriptional regulator